MIAFSNARHEPHAMMVETIAAMFAQLTVLCAIRKNYLEIYTHNPIIHMVLATICERVPHSLRRMSTGELHLVTD